MRGEYVSRDWKRTRFATTKKKFSDLAKRTRIAGLKKKFSDHAESVVSNVRQYKNIDSQVPDTASSNAQSENGTDMPVWESIAMDALYSPWDSLMETSKAGKDDESLYEVLSECAEDLDATFETGFFTRGLTVLHDEYISFLEEADQYNQYIDLYNQLDAEIDALVDAKTQELYNDSSGMPPIVGRKYAIDALCEDPEFLEMYTLYHDLGDYLYPESDEPEEEPMWYENIFQLPENWENTFELFDDGYQFGDADRLNETGYGLQGTAVNGYYDGDAVTININSTKALNSVVGHEITHALEGTDFYTPLRDAVIRYAKDTGQYDSHISALRQIYSGKQGYDTDFDFKVEQELVANMVGDYLFSDTDFVRNLSVQNRNLFLRLFDEIRYLGRLATAGSKEARELEKIKKLFDEAYRETKNTAQPDGVKYSLVGRTADGLGIYKTNYPKGTPKAVKQSDLISLVQNVWCNEPIDLKIVEDGKYVDITAKFNPTLGERTDLAKIAFGNRKGTAAEQRMTLDLASDLYHIASESKFRYSKDAIPKPNNPAHDGVTKYHYFITNLIYKDTDGNYTQCHMNIDVKRNAESDWFYSFAIEKGSAPQTLLAAVTDESATLPNNNIQDNGTNVNRKLSLSMDNADVPQQGNNIYDRDVALENREETVPAGYQPDPDQVAPTAEDIAAMEQEQADQPEDNMEMLYRGLQEISGKTAQPDTPEQIRAKAENIVGDRNRYLSKRADALYQEISSLKKGVRASKDLGYLLDHGYDWQSIKTALLNIRDNPDQMVNPNSMAEQTARKMLSDAYDGEIFDNEQRLQFAPAPESIKTVKDRNQAKLHNYTTELVNNMQKRDDVIADYDEEISELQARYDGMKNKSTVAANDLFRRIERKKRLRDNAAASYEKRISDLHGHIERMTTDEFKTAQQRQLKQEEYATWAEDLVGDTSTWVDKKTGWGYMTNTLRRNLRAIVKDANGKPDYKKADAIYEELQGKYNQHEADMNRELTKLRNKYAKMDITKAEDVYIQMLGEFRHNPSTTLTEDAVKGYYEKHKKTIDTAKVDKIIKMARQDYDSLIQRVNVVLHNQGMKEIPYRKGYFPHFTNDKQGMLGKLLNGKTKNDDIPTDIAGLTEQFEPVRSYQPFNKERKTDITDYSFKKGFDSYSFGALDWIHHIEDIQKRRALENHIRYTHSDEGVKQKVDAIKANESLNADEAQEQIDLVYKEARNPLNNFVIDLRRGTQTLAGKKSSLDREMEYDTNRKIYSTMTNISNRVSANMVAGSFSAALTNFIPITQSWGTVSPLRSLQAMAQTMKSTIRDDGMVDKSTFLTNRLRQAESLNKTGLDKASDKISWLMNAVDSFTSQTVWRSKYDTNIAKGMSESEAIHDADLFAESVLAGRSRGNMPTIFDSKNPIVKMLTAFQLEVANQYGYLFQDMPQDAKNKNIANLVGKYATVFVGAYAYNALFSSLTGRTAALDPLRIIAETLKDAGLGDDEEDEDELMWSEIFGNLSENILQEVPFVGGLLGGGRVPISSALPYDNIVETFKGTSEDFEKYVKSTDENMPWYSRPFSGDKEHIRSLTKEWLKPIFYVAFPMGGGQLKKSIEGASMFLGDKPVPGSYTTGGDLRFPVETTPENVIQATLFGQWASQNAQDYIDQGRKPLSEKQSEEFLELDIPIQDYWQIRDDLSDMDSLSEKADYIAGLDLSTEQKNVLINNVTDRKEKIDLQDYDQYGGWEEYDFYLKNPEKYDFLQERSISYDSYKAKNEEYDFAYRNPEKYDFLNESGVTYDDWDSFNEDEKSAWTWAYNNPEKYLLSKSVTDDVTRYRRYTDAINNIKSDKDRYGNAISGSRKKKVIAYINGLSLKKEEKMILFKMEYPSHDDDNKKIIAYIKELDGFTEREKRQMLKELGFTVKNGKVYWD